MGLTAAEIVGAVALADRRMQTLEHELNAADAKLGDGDTGTMLARLFDGLTKAPVGEQADVGAVLVAFATAAARTTGSSLGTLVSIGFRSMGKATAGKNEIAWPEIGDLLKGAADAMMARGGARLGDKTVIDALQAVADATAGAAGPEVARERAVDAAAAALQSFRGRPCKVGRARMYPTESANADDPGMLAFVRLTETICGPAT